MDNTRSDHRPRYRTVEIDPDACTGCNMCVEICMMDVFSAAAKKGDPPIVAYPEECWFEGSCIEVCPRREQGAIRVSIPLPMRVSVLRGADPIEERQGKPGEEER
jgi:NAD-dependent dihydropyrimidine dehydrogenase PreA subunit